MCPSFVVRGGNDHDPEADPRLWADYADPDRREYPELQRYRVTVRDSGGENHGEIVHESDDPDAAIRAVIVETVALRFDLALQADLTAEEYAEMIRRNLTETNPHVCHSHDFRDSNVIMADVFKGIRMAEYSDDVIPLWSAAWDRFMVITKTRYTEAETLLQAIRSEGFDVTLYDEAAKEWNVEDDTVTDASRSHGPTRDRKPTDAVRRALGRLNAYPYALVNALIS